MDHRSAGAELAAALSVVIPLNEIIDELGELNRRKQERKPDEDREAYLKEQLDERYANLPPGTPTVSQGDLYTLQVSARQIKRTIVAPMKLFLLLRKQLGLEALVALLKILLETVDKYIPESKHKLFLIAERTGHRTYITVPKASPQRKAA
jgi:hypothetical protein